MTTMTTTKTINGKTYSINRTKFIALIKLSGLHVAQKVALTIGVTKGVVELWSLSYNSPLTH
jgi:hypothetical protein